MTQLSLFSEQARPPALADLDGLLAGPAQLVRRGDGARVSVVVGEAWRAQALSRELAERLSIVAEIWEGRVVRTPFLGDLLALALRWTRGASKAAPGGLVLDGPRLRWWCLAAGSARGDGYTLAVGPGDEAVWPAVGAALAAAGLPAAFVGPRADGPGYRVVGRRRLARLRELVGDPPAEAPAGDWPQ